jgi:hypothetical protein
MSANQLGMHFIENGGVTLANKRATLIRAGVGVVRHHITGFDGAAIRDVIDSIASNHDRIGRLDAHAETLWLATG